MTAIADHMSATRRPRPPLRAQRSPWSARRCRPGAIALSATTWAVLLGCQTTQQQAREEATQRWNLARAQVKAKLAADQFAAGNVAAAARELTEVSRLMPDNPDLVPLQARIWLAEGRLSDAERLLEQTRREQPPRAAVEYLLGVVRQQQERWSEAHKLFVRAAELDPDEIGYVVAAAQADLQLGRPWEALRRLESAAPRLRWTSAYQAALAECHEQLGEWPAAAAAWERVVGSDTTPATRERLAIALYRADRPADAVPVLQALLAEEPYAADTTLRLMLAQCYLATRQPAAARAQIELALRHDADNPAALRLLARSWAASGQFAPALRAAQRALNVDSVDVSTLELTAALAQRAGNQRLAASLAERLRQLDPQNALAARLLPASAPSR